MKKILILCAREEELNAFLSLLPYSKDEEGYYHQELGGDQITLGIAGIGKVARAGSLSRYLANHATDLRINVGVAGSLSEELPPLSTLVASQCAYWDVDVTAFGYKRGQRCGHPLFFETDSFYRKKIREEKPKNVVEGLILSGDTFITAKNKPDWLKDVFPQALAIDRESAAFAQIGYDCKIPFLVIRSISDDTNANGNKEVYEELLNKACLEAAKLTFKAIQD